MVEKITGEARRQALAGLDGWEEVGDRDAICKSFRKCWDHRARGSREDHLDGGDYRGSG